MVVDDDIRARDVGTAGINPLMFRMDTIASAHSNLWKPLRRMTPTDPGQCFPMTVGREVKARVGHAKTVVMFPAVAMFRVGESTCPARTSTKSA